MFKIVSKRNLNPTVTMMDIEAPLVAKKAEAGQFIILRTDEDGERIPLTVAGFDREKGTVKIIFQIVGATTEKLNHKNVGDCLADFAGPLGKPTETEGLRKVCVVGGGDTAMEDALYLARFASKVTIIHRRDSFRAAQALVCRVQQTPNVKILYHTVVKALRGEEQLEEIVVQNTLSGAESAFRTQGLFVAVGTVPQTELLAGQLALQEGYVIAGEDTRTSVRGVYAAGDIRTKPLRQVICAASDGAVAAAMVQADLNSIEIG